MHKIYRIFVTVMDITTLDMKKEFAYYNEVAPVKEAKLTGGSFKYRYYKNPAPVVDATVVILAGGTGLADGFFAIARNVMEHYSLLTFNYPMDFKGNDATADAIAELVKLLEIHNAYYWGQSYGGLLAQLIAKRHPEVVKGLLLTSTASFSTHLRYEGMQCLVKMLDPEKEQKRYRMYKRLPVKLMPALMSWVFKKHLKDKPGAAKAVKELMYQLKDDFSSEYLCHMTSLLADLRNQMGTHSPEDFYFLDGHVLIIEPDDDKTFTDDIKEELYAMMPNPKVVHKIEGGHVAILFNPDSFMQIIHEFMEGQVL